MQFPNLFNDTQCAISTNAGARKTLANLFFF